MRQDSESGAILVVTMLASLLLLGLGLAVLWVGASQTRIAGNINRRQEALYAAESGLSRARAILGASVAWTGYTETGCGGWDDPLKGRVLCDPTMTTPQQNIQVAVAPLPTPGMQNIRYIVYVRNDDAEGDKNVAAGLPRERDNDRRVVVRVEGTAVDGISVVAIEASLNMDPGALPPLSAPQVEGWREARD